MFAEFPTFNFSNYTVRAIKAEQDAELFYHYITHKDVRCFLGEDSIPQSIDEARRELSYWASLYSMGRSYYWAIANEDDNIIGTIGFNYIIRQHARAEISYDLDKNYWGKGIMTNSLFHMIEFAFNKLGMVRIQATVGQHNPRSIKTLENLGFKREGELAKYEKLEGKHYDFYMYAITRNV